MLRATLRRPFIGVIARDGFSQGNVRPVTDVERCLGIFSVVLLVVVVVVVRRIVRGCSIGNWARPRRGEGVRARRSF